MQLAADQIEEVRTLLAAGELTLAQIARATGLGRTTVARISSGTPRRVPPQRCRGCGGLVEIWPCPKCAADARHKARRLSA